MTTLHVEASAILHILSCHNNTYHYHNHLSLLLQSPTKDPSTSPSVSNTKSVYLVENTLAIL